jgi:dihydrofolate reductase
MVAHIQTTILSFDAMLFGRSTYEEFAGFWPQQTDNAFGIADKLNQMPKYVVSTRLEHPSWNNTRVIQSDAVEAIRTLKRDAGGTLGINGSGMLVQMLMQAGLVDAYHLMLHPILVGQGKRLFKEGLPTALKLVETQAFQSGVLALTYEPIQEGQATSWNM